MNTQKQVYVLGTDEPGLWEMLVGKLRLLNRIACPSMMSHALQITQVANYTARVAFGVALLTSIAVVWTAILIVLSSSNNDRDDRCVLRSRWLILCFAQQQGNGWSVVHDQTATVDLC